MLTCPHSACDHEEIPTVGQMAAHLVEVHLVTASDALRRAREIADALPLPPCQQPMIPRKEDVMTTPAPNTKDRVVCRACGARGHTKRSPECPKRGEAGAKAPPTECGYCKRPADRPHADRCPHGAKKRAPVTRSPKPAPAKRGAASPNGFSGVLAALRDEHAELAAAIAALERLEARR